ncbi:MAG: S8 family peptidase [Phycisphaerae bacterium]|nr:S8 family peptidase [Phycisphaerae bacterium]
MIAAMSSGRDARDTAKRYFRISLPTDESVWGSTGARTVETLHANIVGAPSRNVAHLSTTLSSAQLMLDELQRYNAPNTVGKSKFAILEELGSIPTSEKISLRAESLLQDPDADATVLVQLFADLSSIEARAVAQTMTRWLAANAGTVEDTAEMDSGVCLRVRARSRVIREVASSFLCVQSVDPIAYAVEESSAPSVGISNTIQVLPNTSNARVAIFDSGVVRGSRFLDGSLLDHEEPFGRPYNTDHGTFVASRIIYGDTLRSQIASGTLTPTVKVLSVCTSTVDDIGNQIQPSTEQLAKLVRKTVERWHQQIKVYNFSQSLFPKNPGAESGIDNVVSVLAAEFDALSRKYGVMFVTTTGNYPRRGAPPPSVGYPAHFAIPSVQMVPPAEAVLSMTVGSVAILANDGSLAPSKAPSPFTRKGPGFAGFQKPDLVAHGGNYGQYWQETPDLSPAGIGNHGDFIAHGVGTSFATPLVSRLAAQVFAALPSATPALVRALLIHLSEAWPCVIPISGVSAEHLLGYGHADGERLLTSVPQSQAFVHFGTLPHREIRRVPFFVPAALASRRGRARVRVRATIVWTPETSRALKAGYCKSNVRCKLVKVDADGNLAEVAGDGVPSPRYASICRLEKTFSSHIAPGAWELIVEHESRWTLKDDQMPIAIVITVEDPRPNGGVDVPASIRAEAPAQFRTQLVSPVRIRS